ncbi:hypothetical protein GCM10028803_21690 [Larkinella knui]
MALVSLGYLDYVAANEQDRLSSRSKKKQVDTSRYKEFRAFNQYLLKIDKERRNGQTRFGPVSFTCKMVEDHKYQ